MRPPANSCGAFADNRAVAHDDAADGRVGRGPAELGARQLQRAGHEAPVIFAEGGRSRS